MIFFYRKGSQRRQGISHPTPPQIKIEESVDTEDGYVSDSSSTVSDDDTEVADPDLDNHLRPGNIGIIKKYIPLTYYLLHLHSL